MKPVLLAATAAVLVAISGCATSDCDGICGKFNECTVAQRAVEVDCPEFCKNVAALNTRAQNNGHSGCDSLFTQHINCWKTNGSALCDTTSTVCDQTALDWMDCVVGYCDSLSSNQLDQECVGGEGYGSLSLITPFQSGF